MTFLPFVFLSFKSKGLEKLWVLDILIKSMIPSGHDVHESINAIFENILLENKKLLTLSKGR